MSKFKRGDVMKKEIYELNEKIIKLFLEYEKIEVLIKDMYGSYFGMVDEGNPDTFGIIDLYFKPNSVKCGILVDLLPHTNELFSEIKGKFEELLR